MCTYSNIYLNPKLKLSSGALLHELLNLAKLSIIDEINAVNRFKML